MKPFLTTLLIAMLTFSLAFGQTPHYKVGKKQIDRGHTSSARQVTGSLTSTNFYIPGTTMDLTFTLELTNTDQEFGDSLSLTFPPGIAPNSSPDDPFPSPITGGQGGEALNGTSGQVISWGDNDNAYGGIEPGNVIAFTVNVTIMAGVTGAQTVDFFVSGDEFGPSPSPLLGGTSVMEAPNTPVGSINNDNFSSLTAIGSPETSAAIQLTNLGLGTLHIMSTASTNPEFTTTFMADSILGGMNHSFTITYSPTDLVDDVDTFKILTDGGNFNILLFGYAYGNGVTLEGFEDTTAFPPCQWSMSDEDGDGFNWGPYPFTPHSGNLCASTASFQNGVGPLTPDNYLISPQLSPVAGKDFLSYWVAAQDAAFPAEKYSISVSTTGTNISDFTTVEFTETLSSIDWKEVTVDLAAYNGMDIYVAFRHFDVTDEFLMKLDDVRLPPLKTPSPVFSAIMVTLATTNEMCAGDSMGSVNSTVTGGAPSLAYSWSDGSTTPNLANLTSGTYMVTVSDNCGTTPATMSATVTSDNPVEDPSFSFDALVYCNTGSNPSPTVAGTAGGVFTSVPQVVFVDAFTGEVDVTASTVGGPYAITYTTPGPCTESTISNILIQDCTPIDDLNTQGISLYPNPSEGVFVIENIGEARAAVIEVTDLTGKTIYTKSLFLGRAATHQVDLTGTPTGVYLVKIISDDKVGLDKIVIR